MTKIPESKIITTKQLCDAIFNVHKFRNLTISVVGGADYELSFPAQMGKNQERKRKNGLFDSLLTLEKSGCICAVVFSAYDMGGKEVMGLHSLPDGKGWYVLEPEQMERAYTTCSDCGEVIETPANVRYAAITKYL